MSNYSGSAWSRVLEEKYLYDGWNLLGSFNATNSAVVQAFLWGTDLSGSMQGAGGVGGLLAVNAKGVSVTFAAYDGNGNVTDLANAADGSTLATYEYGPFGEVIRASGTAAKTNPFRFSTKFQDDETDYLYYGYRFYSQSSGRWLSRDPFGERGGMNLSSFIVNDPVNRYDLLGLASACSDCRKLCGVTCKLKSGPSFSPSGTITATKLLDGRKTASFNMTAEFEHDLSKGYCAGCCEVRVYLKWSSDDDAPFHGGWLPARSYPSGSWYEDRDSDGNMAGHRDGPGSAPTGNDQYVDGPGSPNNKCGSRYFGHDAPVDVSGRKTGWWKFQMKVINKCSKDGKDKEVASSDELTIQWQSLLRSEL